MSITITVSDGTYTFADTEQNLVLCFVGKHFLTDKGKKMIDNANQDNLANAEFFYELAKEQIGVFRHINAVGNYLVEGIRYSIWYDGYRREDLAKKFNHLAPDGYHSLTKEDLITVVEAGLPTPAKDIKISRLNYTAGFSLNPSMEDIKLKFPEFR